MTNPCKHSYGSQNNRKACLYLSLEIQMRSTMKLIGPMNAKQNLTVALNKDGGVPLGFCLSCQRGVQFRLPEQARDPQYPQVTFFPFNRYAHDSASPSSVDLPIDAFPQIKGKS
jgi:hypothetical protein